MPGTSAPTSRVSSPATGPEGAVRGAGGAVEWTRTGQDERTLRSAQWYAGEDRNAYIHRAWMRRGVPAAGFERPQIAIANTASDLTPCNMHLSEVARSVRDGVHAAG